MKAKVRFHLARGQNYMRWQVKQGDSVQYYDPEDVILEMHEATLRNQRKTAERIMDGENKTVCAWVECESIRVNPCVPDTYPLVKDFAHYNPRRRPYWHDSKKNNLDNSKYKALATYGKLIVIPK
jgi:hypothetical protein